MERDTALKQLQDMRQEILKIYADSDKCRKISDEVEKLVKEKENPTGPSFTAENENTHDDLKEKFITENRSKLLYGHKAERIILVISAILTVAVTVAFFFDIFYGTGILIKRSVLAEKVGSWDIYNRMIAVGFQAVISVLITVVSFKKLWR